MAEAIAVSKRAGEYANDNFRKEPWPLYWPVWALVSFGIPIAAVAIAAFLTAALVEDVPGAAGWFWAGLIALFGCSQLYRHRAAGFVGRATQSVNAMNTHLSLLDAGYLMTSDGSSYFLPWRGIYDIRSDSGFVLIGLSPVHCLFIVKASYESQNFDAFITELERRWQAAKSGPGHTMADSVAPTGGGGGGPFAPAAALR